MINISSPLSMFRSLKAMQDVAMQKEGATPKSWLLYVTKDQYAYIKRRKLQYTHFPLRRLVIVNNATNILQAPPTVVAPTSL